MSDTELKPGMTLDEAIEHCKEKVDCTQCGEEHRQLAEWLIELKNRRAVMEQIVEQLEEQRGIAFLTLANASDIPDMVYEKVSQYLDKAIEIVKKGGVE